jgi:tetratricopeptide (TPR) repeat protein
MANARLEELKARFEENPRRYFAPFANELRKTGDFAQAISICRTHLVTQPGHVSGHIVLAQALQEAGELDESRTQFEAALELDPENLIALRHMGDIARTRGDLESARGWYQRVLDADPRNDDIARVLRELPTSPNDAAPVAAEPSKAPAAPEAVPAPATPPAASTPKPPELSYGPPDPSMFAAPAPSTAAVPREKAAPPSAQSTPEGLAGESREPEPAAQAEAPQEPKAGSNDLDSFDAWYLPGTTRQLDTPAPSREGGPGASAPDDSHGNEDAFHLAGELSTPDDSWLPKPTPAADLSDHEAAPNFWLDATLSETGGEPAQGDTSTGKASGAYHDDIETWFESHATPPSPPDPAPASADAARSPSDAEPSWLSAHETPTHESTPDAMTTPSESSAGWSEPEARRGRDTPGPSAATPATVDPVLGRAPDSHETASESRATPFVTETLAELYLQQGFRDEALAIYRELLTRDPGDEALRRRLEAIEAGETSDVVPGFTVRGPAPSDRSAISVRTFFGRLARRGVGQPRGGHDGGGQGRTTDSVLTRPRTGAFPALPERAAELSTGQGGGAHGGPSSSLANLFGNASPPESDTRAANALAAAFTESPMPGTPGGRPARMAERELSLDHLFREGSDASAGSTSMDDFYRPPAPGGAADSAQREPGAPEERTADLRQFTAWLEGLKKK